MSKRSEKQIQDRAEPDLQPRGWAEVDGAVIRGWARDPLGGKPATLFLIIDDTVAARLACTQTLEGRGLPEEAVGASFRIVLPQQLDNGRTHRVALRFADGQALPFRSPSGILVPEWLLQHMGRYAIEGVVDGLTGAALRGWIIRRNLDTKVGAGGETVEVLRDGRIIGQAVANLFRPDVAAAMSCEPNCGYSFVLPPALRNGQPHLLTVRAAGNGEQLGGSPVEVRLLSEDAISKLSDIYEEVDRVCVQNYLLREELKRLLDTDEFSVEQYNTWATSYFARLRTRVEERLGDGIGTPDTDMPLVSIVCPVYKPEPGVLDATIQSVRRQTYRDWELILVDDGGKTADVTKLMEQHAQEDKRVRLLPQKRNAGISAATNVGVAAAKGRYVAFLDHDDLIEDVAVQLMVAEAVRTGAKVLYSDEDKIQNDGVLSEPHLKSDWNYRLLLSYNYVCHFLMVEREALVAAGPLDSEYDGAQDHDLILRLAERLPPEAIHHVPEILYHWRKSLTSTALSGDTKGYAADAGRRAVNAHLARRKLPGKAGTRAGITRYSVEWSFKDKPSVSIIVPFRDQADVTKRCVDMIFANTGYPNYEVVLADNWSTRDDMRAYLNALRNEPRARTLRIEEEFNFSRINNKAVATCKSDFVLFLNNDVYVSQLDWIDQMVAEALADPRVGAVGAKLLYPNGAIQHAGVILGVGGVADHAFRGTPRDDAGYFSRASCAQQLSAVTAACMLCRTSAFREVGGFDEETLKIAFNDVDLCLRLGRAGWKIIFQPGVVAEHHESLSRGSDIAPEKRHRFFAENQAMMERWGAALTDDPFYNPHFARSHGIYTTLSSKVPAARDVSVMKS